MTMTSSSRSSPDSTQREYADNIMQVHSDSKDFVVKETASEQDTAIITVRSTHRHSINIHPTHGSRTAAERLYEQGIDFLYGCSFIGSSESESNDTI
jgi:hypothetical protein